MDQKPLKEAISLIFRHGNKVWVFKRSDNKKTHPSAWSLPSTYIHQGETIAETANRLVRRKLGLDSVILHPEPLGQSPVVDKEMFLLQMTDYLVDSYSGVIAFDPSEYTEKRLVTAAELLNLIKEENEPATVEIFDMTGRLVNVMEVNTNTEIKLGKELTPNTYLLRIIMLDEVVVTKIVKN